MALFIKIWIASAAMLLSACTTSPPRTDDSKELAGTAWRLVKFVGGDDTTRTPDDRNKYSAQLNADGSVAARVDCNRGRGTWKSEGPGQIEFGPLALTRAMCPPGSMHDQMLKHWPYVRSYVMKDGHLFLSLLADGGIYEFEPAAVGSSQ